MALDIFGREASTVDAAFSADSSSLTFNKGKGGNVDAATANLLTQSLQASYSQSATRLYELGSNKSTMIQGRTQGNVSISRVIGPAKDANTFIDKFSSVCNLTDNNVIFNLKGANKSGTGGICKDGSTEGFMATGCLIQNLTYAVEAQELVIRQQLQMQIISLNRTDSAAAAVPA